jgi:hypothetical protein
LSRESNDHDTAVKPADRDQSAKETVIIVRGARVELKSGKIANGNALLADQKGGKPHQKIAGSAPP